MWWFARVEALVFELRWVGSEGFQNGSSCISSFTFLVSRKGSRCCKGVDWGTGNTKRLIPSNVVDLLLQNGIQHARIYTSQEEILQAFVGSRIELTITAGNTIGVDTYEKAKTWIQMRQKYFSLSNIRNVYVGNYAFAAGWNDKSIIKSALQALRSLQHALNDAQYGDQIKATIPQHPSALKMNKTSLRPSEAEFRDELKQDMATLLSILKQNNAPFIANISPLLHVEEFGIDFNYALLQNGSSLVVKDVNATEYTNVFELMYDSYVWALTKLNASDVKVVVGDVGWPTEGHPQANATMAEKFFKGLLPWAASNKGTPMRPGAPIDITIHSLTDENKFKYAYPYMQHYGIYNTDGKPKYKLDLSGHGRDIYPADAAGNMHSPKLWCLFSGNTSDMAKVREQSDKACAKADCNAISCSHLDFRQNVSYAFNMYFQLQNQNETECDFGGLGYVSVKDPSTPVCKFPAEVVKAQQHTDKAAGFHERPNRAIFVFLLSFMGTLL